MYLSTGMKLGKRQKLFGVFEFLAKIMIFDCSAPEYDKRSHFSIY